jgi:peptidoglycan/LPS O-acetylase OafA/YrhL
MAGGRIDELDGLRAIAILFVIAAHGSVLWGAAIGVDVFFVLSGWLITGILAGGRSWPEFYAGRVRRLFPALAVMLAVVLTLEPSLWREAIWTLCYAMNIRFMTDIPIKSIALAHTWSLSLEEQFYIVWPFVVAGLVRLGCARAVGLLLGCWAVMTAVRGALFVAGLNAIAYNSPLHATGMLLGAALALWQPKGATPAVGLAGLSLVVISALLRFGPAPYLPFIWQIPLAEIGSALVILAPPATLAARPLVALGRISYGVYLWHMPINEALPPMGPIQHTAIVLAASVTIAAISWRWVERPFLRMRPYRLVQPPEPA